ncbi:MAG: PEP-CTERM sorting domain-containing protein [Leptolyngbyaceae cyanobacterium SM1_1_3]|nr:PEP-CTERM sorting domain-containing protein [Leptolyngbyaceae cyanobacterium SM1_1_3]NJN04020.1 PEP-CTERM sorting domain-containing protein [Leptolyngbyaceae cyanobacterium RM1_1_2]
MKHVVLAATAALSLVALAAPAEAALFSWNVEYTGWWEAEGGGTISGSLVAEEESALDGILSPDELTSWFWNWSGNDFVSAFSISSDDPNAEIQVFDVGFDSGFYVDGTPNLPNLADDLDQAVFAAGDLIFDLEFLLVQNLATDGSSAGDPDASGLIAVAEPTPVPEPALLLSLLVSGAGAAALKRQKQAA